MILSILYQLYYIKIQAILSTNMYITLSCILHLVRKLNNFTKLIILSINIHEIINRGKFISASFLFFKLQKINSLDVIC